MSGRYQWDDEWPLTFTAWGVDQPNGEDCVYLDNKGYWNGDNCTMMKPFICKYTSGMYHENKQKKKKFFLSFS